MREQTLRVIARAIGLSNGYRHSPGESREEDRALDLGTGNGARVRESAQLPPVNRQRKPIPRLLNPGSHFLEWLGHPPHRPPPQRGVAGECRAERVAG